VKLLWTTARSTPAASDLLLFRTLLEGQDLQRIRKGTSDAQQLTFSFWVKSNVTGTYVARIEDVDNSRHVGATYSISVSGTWERKTITFPADITGAFDNNNEQSLRVDFGLLAGTDWSSGTLPTTWGSYLAANVFPGQVNVAAATNNYWQVTGVQLEVGPAATPFEFKSFGQELRECQRYYFRYTNGGDAVSGRIPGMARLTSTTQGNMTIPFPQPMRARPSAMEFSGVRVTDNSAFDTGDCTISMGTNRSTSAALLGIDATTGGTAGSGYSVFINGATAFLGFSAEL
jgi:hypothetical protein